MAEIWGVLAAAAVGAGVSLYGANQQKKANAAAIASNEQQNQDAINENWRRYLMTRGVGDNGQPVNTRLPLWASVTRPPGGGTPRLTTGAYIPGASPAPALGSGSPSAGGGRTLAGIFNARTSRMPSTPQLALGV